MSNGILTKVRANSAQPFGILSHVRGASTDPRVGRIVSARGRTVENVWTIDLPDTIATLEPFATVSITALTSQVADSYTWSKSDAGITLVGSGDTRTFVVPARLAAFTFTVTVVAHKAGFPDATDTVTYSVYPHAGEWKFIGGSLVATKKVS